MSTNGKPVMDEGLPKPEVPFRAGGKEQGSLATRKTALSDTGSIGYVPGHEGSGRGSSLRAGYVHEAPVPPAPPGCTGRRAATAGHAPADAEGNAGQQHARPYRLVHPVSRRPHRSPS